MEALVCDICGGNLAVGTGGKIFCGSCGMEYTQERMREKYQERNNVHRVVGSRKTVNWMKRGSAAVSAGNLEEAYECFTRVLEVDPENWRAIFEKGKAGAFQSTLENLRVNELDEGITIALEIIQRSNSAEVEIAEIKNEFAVAQFTLNNAITDLMDENLFEIEDLYYHSHFKQIWNTKLRFLKNVEMLEDALRLIVDLQDDLSKGNVIEFKKRMCMDIVSACRSDQFWYDKSKSTLGYAGFSSSEKQDYLDKFSSLLYDIRFVEPDFATTKYSQPDPFDAGFEADRVDRIVAYWKKQDDKRRLKIT